VANERDVYRYGAMPEEVLELLGGPWSEKCTPGSYTMYGVSLIQDKIKFGESEVSYPVKCPHDLRPAERMRYIPRRMTEAQMSDYHISLWFDRRPFVQEEAAQSLAMTLFVCVCLLTAAMMFHNDVSQLVLYPVETMISRVQTIRDNPMTAIQMAEEEFRKETGGDLGGRRSGSKTGEGSWGLGSFGMKQEPKPTFKERAHAIFKKVLKVIACDPKAPTEPMETLILERTIIKLGSLLVLGFGEAGANIVTQNMRGQHSASVCAMVAGLRVDCVIGSVRIQDFSIVTEVLQTDVMNFVNQVAEIVHGVTDEFHGAPNKNNGDTFLVIWRTTGMECELSSKLADLAVTAFARIIGAVHQSPVLANYRGHPGLQWRVGSDYRVTLNTGLHCGWAIEGAVGSEFKIDASYLSPNVSVAVNVEDYTQVYGVNFLATDAVVNICTPPMRGVCRLVDNVFISGSKEPLKLYSIDLCWHDLEVDEPLFLGRKQWNTRMRFRARQWLETEKQRKMKANSIDLFEGNSSIGPMREKYTTEFFQLFSMGYQNYHQGEWRVAMTFLKHTRTMLGFLDGPSCALMDFMENPYAFEAPEDWNGVRDLDEAAKVRSPSLEHQRELLEEELRLQIEGASGGGNAGSALPELGRGATFSRSNTCNTMCTIASEWDANGARKIRRKGTTTGKRKGNRGAALRRAQAMLAFANTQSDEIDSPEGVASVDVAELALRAPPSGDGTGGTGSRRASPVIPEESVFDYCSRLQQQSNQRGSGSGESEIVKMTSTPSTSSKRVLIKTGAGMTTTHPDDNEIFGTKGSWLNEDWDPPIPSDRKIKPGHKDPNRIKGKLRPVAAPSEAEASTGATGEVSESLPTSEPARRSGQVKTKKHDKGANERKSKVPPWTAGGRAASPVVGAD